MTRYGYTLMTEQSGPRELVRYAQAAEDAGFDLQVMSDHYSPWLEAQGHAGYAWSMLVAVAQATSRTELMTYVTCPIMRAGSPWGWAPARTSTSMSSARAGPRSTSATRGSSRRCTSSRSCSAAGT